MAPRRFWRPRAAVPGALGNQIYGLLIVGAALAVARPRAHNRWTVLLDAFATAVVYSCAHVYAHAFDERVRQARPLTGPERRAIAMQGVAVLRATGVPFVALLVCTALRVSEPTSVDIALWLLAGELAATAWFATTEFDSRGRRVAYAIGATGLGLVLIVLKVATH